MTSKPWQLKKWKDNRVVKLKSACEICSSTTQPLCIHHLNSTESFEKYIDMSGSVVTLCKKCHFRIHKDYVPCRKCEGKSWHKSIYNCCFNCLPKNEQLNINSGVLFDSETSLTEETHSYANTKKFENEKRYTLEWSDRKVSFTAITGVPKSFIKKWIELKGKPSKIIEESKP